CEICFGKDGDRGGGRRTRVTAMFGRGRHLVRGRRGRSGMADGRAGHQQPRSDPNESVLSPSTVGDLEVAWTLHHAGPVSATPAVVDGAVHIPDRADASTRWTRRRKR